MGNLINELRRDFTTAFENLDPNWNHDDLFCELYKTTGKIAVDYGNAKFKEGKSKVKEVEQTHIDDLVIQLITKITDERKQKDPSTANKKDIKELLIEMFDKSLINLEKVGKVKSYESINFKRYEIQINK